MDDTPELDEAVKALREARTRADAFAPVRRTLTEVDAETKSAAMQAAAAGLGERVIADLLGVAQPTVHGWLDGRYGSPLPAPDAATMTWALHHLVIAAATQSLRAVSQAGLEGVTGPPNPTYIDPGPSIKTAYDLLTKAADLLGRSAVALDKHASVSSRFRGALTALS